MRGFHLYFLGGILQVFDSSVFHIDNSFTFTLLHMLLLWCAGCEKRINWSLGHWHKELWIKKFIAFWSVSCRWHLTSHLVDSLTESWNTEMLYNSTPVSFYCLEFLVAGMCWLVGLFHDWFPWSFGAAAWGSGGLGTHGCGLSSAGHAEVAWLIGFCADLWGLCRLSRVL